MTDPNAPTHPVIETDPLELPRDAIKDLHATLGTLLGTAGTADADRLAALETELAAARAEVETWRHKAVHRAIGISRLRGTLAAVLDLASEEVARADAWGGGYRAAQVDLREALLTFGYPDQQLIAEHERITRGGDHA